MKEIRIEGLTPEQCDMLDIMWDIGSTEDFIEWMDTLSDEEVRMAITLKEVLLAHCFDEINETNIARDYLNKFRL